jgi:hypothetical protein
VQITPERPVQSADVGNTPRVRKKKFREVQSIKEQAKIHMDKLSKGLRP